MEERQMDELDQELTRKQAARAGYIAWRMNDVPAIYHTLMPVSYDAAELWEAEKAIRRQYKIDVAFDKQPWKRIGQPCVWLDYSALDGVQKMTFGLECEPFAGLTDLPKSGRDAEVRDILDAARDKWLAEH